MAEEDEGPGHRVDRDEASSQDAVDRDAPAGWARPPVQREEPARRRAPALDDDSDALVDRDEDDLWRDRDAGEREPAATAPPPQEDETPPAAFPWPDDDDGDFDATLDDGDDFAPAPPLRHDQAPEAASVAASQDAFNEQVERELTDGPLFADAAAATPAAGDGEAAAPPRGRRWLAVPVAIVIVAVVLLAVGGYGVVEERNALQAQIRDLQAQLAVSVPADQARAARQTRSAQAARLQELTATVDALRAERDELAAELAAARDSLAASEARSASLAAARDRALAEAEKARAAAGTDTGGPWFVNFGTYAQRSDAARWADRLTVDTGKVVVQDAAREGETLFRVRVVGLDDRAGAESIARALEARHGLPRLWVGRSEAPP